MYHKKLAQDIAAYFYKTYFINITQILIHIILMQILCIIFFDHEIIVQFISINTEAVIIKGASK